MKFLTISLAVLMTLSVNAAEFAGFRVENIKASKVSVYLVAGVEGVGGSIDVSTVFKKIGTFNNDNGVVEVPATEYMKDGWRGPTHVLAVTHFTPSYALDKDEKEGFEDPKYLDLSDRVAPNGNNLKFKQRDSIHKIELIRANRVFILSDR